MTATDGDRARFEAWARGRELDLPINSTLPNEYWDIQTQFVWEAWQAASAELADLRACVEAADVMRDRYERVWRGSKIVPTTVESLDSIAAFDAARAKLTRGQP